MATEEHGITYTSHWGVGPVGVERPARDRVRGKVRCETCGGTEAVMVASARRAGVRRVWWRLQIGIGAGLPAAVVWVFAVLSHPTVSIAIQLIVLMGLLAAVSMGLGIVGHASRKLEQEDGVWFTDHPVPGHRLRFGDDTTTTLTLEGSSSF